MNLTEITPKRLNQFLDKLDVAMSFCFYGLIFFLPISIALVEIFSGIALLLFLIKRLSRFVFKELEVWRVESSMPLVKEIVKFFKAFGPRDNPLNLPLAVWTGIVFASIFFSRVPMVSLWGFLGKTVQGVFVFITFIECIHSRKRLRVFLMVFLASFVLINVNGLFQYVTGADFIFGQPRIDGRVMSSLRQMNDFATYLIVGIPVLLALVMIGSRQPENIARGSGSFSFLYRPVTKALIFVVLLAALLCLGFTFSRGGWLAFVVGMVFLSVNHRDKRIASACGLIGLVFFMVFFPKLLSARVQFSDVNSLFVNNNRLLYWPASLNIIRAHPVLGVGINAFSQVAKDLDFEWRGYPHNCYLQMTAETGFLGLASFLWMMFVLYKRTGVACHFIKDHSAKVLCTGFLAGLAALLTHAFFDTVLYSTQLNVLFWVVISIVTAITLIWNEEETIVRI